MTLTYETFCNFVCQKSGILSDRYIRQSHSSALIRQSHSSTLMITAFCDCNISDLVRHVGEEMDRCTAGFENTLGDDYLSSDMEGVHGLEDKQVDEGS